MFNYTLATYSKANHRFRWDHRIKDDRIEVWFLISLHLKEALPRHIEESSSRREGRVSSRLQIV